MSIIDDLTAASQVRGLLEEDRAQLAAVRGEFYEIDGTVFDLGRTFVDVTGGRWQWTGCRDDRSVPLMDFLKHPGDHRDMTVAEREPVPLDEVQRWFGPLIPEPARLTAADYQRALLAPTPRDVFGGAA